MRRSRERTLSIAAASKPRLVTDDHESTPMPTRARRVRPLKLRVHSLLRWLHIYTSMASLLIVLFFGHTLSEWWIGLLLPR